MISKNIFIEKAILKHGNKYDYNLLPCEITSAFKVKIICPLHGCFEQRPSSHIMGYGCLRCSGCNKKTSEEFIYESKTVHGDKYDYSEVEYKNSNSEVVILCKIHGNFSQKAILHINGYGCPICGGSKKYTLEQVIARIKDIHGEKYDCSKVVYNNSKTKITLVCKVHGDFNILPNDIFTKKSGCNKCGIAVTALKCSSNVSDFIEKSNIVHYKKYDYSKVEYKNTHKKVTIICPIHGEFKQAPSNHLIGQGCCRCRDSKGELQIINFLKKIGFEYQQEVRFKSCKNKQCLPFDFLVRTNDNLFFLIEYQGEHHYTPVRWNSRVSDAKANENYCNIKLRDAIKIDWAVKYNIPLLLIPYWELHNINNVIYSFLENHSA